MGLDNSFTNEKIIAPFMDYVYVRHDDFTGCGNLYRKKDDSKREMWSVQFAYSTSWDQLMPVIEKIESMGYSFVYLKETKKVHIVNDSKQFKSDYVTPMYGQGETKIEAYYNAVVNFITEYKNESK